eukprot:5068335-Prymnesium_polylepis.1
MTLQGDYILRNSEVDTLFITGVPIIGTYAFRYTKRIDFASLSGVVDVHNYAFGDVASGGVLSISGNGTAPTRISGIN